MSFWTFEIFRSVPNWVNRTAERTDSKVVTLKASPRLFKHSWNDFVNRWSRSLGFTSFNWIWAFRHGYRAKSPGQDAGAQFDWYQQQRSRGRGEWDRLLSFANLLWKIVALPWRTSVLTKRTLFYFNFKEDSDSFDSETGDPPGLIPAGDVEDSDMSEVSGFLENHQVRLLP